MIPKARLTLCAAVLLYLAGDFFLFKGPLHQAIQVLSPDSPESIEKARKEGIVARVGHRTISSSQLERALHERLWLEGRTLAALSAEEQTAARKAALADLIGQELLLAEIKAAKPAIDVSAAEIDARLKGLTARFGNKEAL